MRDFTKGHDCIVLTYNDEQHLHKIEILHKLSSKNGFVGQNVLVPIR